MTGRFIKLPLCAVWADSLSSSLFSEAGLPHWFLNKSTMVVCLWWHPILKSRIFWKSIYTGFWEGFVSPHSHSSSGPHGGGRRNGIFQVGLSRGMWHADHSEWGMLLSGLSPPRTKGFSWPSAPFIFQFQLSLSEFSVLLLLQIG
jgi:hypothetical protein